MGLGGVLAAAGIVTVVMNDEPDYADLVPAPDSIVWNEGQETTFFVSTNLDDVDMRINSVALGIANVQGAVPHSGVLMVLGASVGCQDWAVSKLSATVTATGYELEIEVDRDNFTGPAEVFIRHRDDEDSAWVDYTSLRVPGDELTKGYTSNTAKQQIEASSDSSFPTALTRFITIDRDAGAATVDEEAETLLMLPDTGVGLRGCSDHEDVRVTLHGEDGDELNRYEFDIGAAATPTPAPTATPSPDAGYTTRRICADDSSDRSLYLTGGELVGAAFTAARFGLSSLAKVTIGDVPGSAEHRYFFNGTLSGSYQVTVSDAGAGNSQGLDAEVVYPIRLTATDTAGRTKYLDVGVWLDTSVLSPNVDGRCS